MHPDSTRVNFVAVCPSCKRHALQIDGGRAVFDLPRMRGTVRADSRHRSPPAPTSTCSASTQRRSAAPRRASSPQAEAQLAHARAAPRAQERRRFALARAVRGCRPRRYATPGAAEAMTVPDAPAEARRLIAAFTDTVKNDGGPRTSGHPMDVLAGRLGATNRSMPTLSMMRMAELWATAPTTPTCARTPGATG